MPRAKHATVIVERAAVAPTRAARSARPGGCECLAVDEKVAVQFTEEDEDEETLQEPAARAQELFMQLLRMSAESKKVPLDKELQARTLSPLCCYAVES